MASCALLMNMRQLSSQAIFLYPRFWNASCQNLQKLQSVSMILPACENRMIIKLSKNMYMYIWPKMNEYFSFLSGAEILKRCCEKPSFKVVRKSLSHSGTALFAICDLLRIQRFYKCMHSIMYEFLSKYKKLFVLTLTSTCATVQGIHSGPMRLLHEISIYCVLNLNWAFLASWNTVN